MPVRPQQVDGGRDPCGQPDDGGSAQAVGMDLPVDAPESLALNQGGGGRLIGQHMGMCQGHAL